MVNRTRNMLLADLKAIQHLATLTTARINDLSITAWLPVEVLMHIFSTLTECDPPSSKSLKDSKSGKKPHLGWINATHVCRRWRQVALSVPALWTNVRALQTGPWMNEMLARSKLVPFTLSVCIAGDPEACGIVLKAVGPEYISHMKGLHLFGKGHKSDGSLYEYGTEVLANLKHPAPMLESLVLNNVTGSAVLRRDIFACEVPRLRRVAIRKCEGIHWDAPYLRNLTDLDLSFDQNCQTAELLALLKESPMLETLKIAWRKPRAPRTDLPNEKVSLPSLKQFCLDCRADAQCAEFLACLITPSTAQRTFKFYSPDAVQSHRIISLATGFVDATGVASRPSPSQVQINYDKGPRHSQLKLSLVLESEEKHPCLSLLWGTSSSALPAHDIAAVQQLLGSFDARRLTFVAVVSEGIDAALRSVFKDAFSRLPAVSKVALRGRGVGPLLSLLEATCPLPPDAEIADVDESTWPSSFLFPRLRALQVTNGLDETTSNGPGAGPSLGSLLLSVVQKREALGEPIHTLGGVLCEGRDPLLRRLQAHVEVMYCERCQTIFD
ncbi:hypothetical protein EWM64_g9080 [Hericium alpestre]|uniref:F-box domain-containing protein n=1 Tax=Hericium alpestre TaxID=135208 RepID=A0A4Y9ZLU5_9AGAM|nr:hypothetical protein EWM64_g9080 [Hericium alpestre]